VLRDSTTARVWRRATALRATSHEAAGEVSMNFASEGSRRSRAAEDGAVTTEISPTADIWTVAPDAFSLQRATNGPATTIAG